MNYYLQDCRPPLPMDCPVVQCKTMQQSEEVERILSQIVFETAIGYTLQSFVHGNLFYVAVSSPATLPSGLKAPAAVV